MNGEVTVALPLSGFVLQWRQGDRSFRIVAQDQLDVVDDSGAELGWQPATGRFSVKGRGQWAHRAGTDPGPSWWIVCGETASEDPVEVELADGTRPLVRTAGDARAAEWVSLPVRAVMRQGGQVAGEIGYDRTVPY